MKRGFTLIELLIVIAIIGILASIVLVSTNSARTKSANVRIQAEVSQLRTAFEQDYVGGTYIGLSGSPSHIASVVSTSSNFADVATLLCAIGKQGSYPTSVAGDVSLECDGIAGAHTGVIIYTNDTEWAVHDYGIYATTTPGGYICTDSFGNSAATTSAGIPAYASLASPSTALCQ